MPELIRLDGAAVAVYLAVVDAMVADIPESNLRSAAIELADVFDEVAAGHGPTHDVLQDRLESIGWRVAGRRELVGSISIDVELPSDDVALLGQAMRRLGASPRGVDERAGASVSKDFLGWYSGLALLEQAPAPGGRERFRALLREFGVRGSGSVSADRLPVDPSVVRQRPVATESQPGNSTRR